MRWNWVGSTRDILSDIFRMQDCHALRTLGRRPVRSHVPLPECLESAERTILPAGQGLESPCISRVLQVPPIVAAQGAKVLKKTDCIPFGLLGPYQWQPVVTEPVRVC